MNITLRLSRSCFVSTRSLTFPLSRLVKRLMFVFAAVRMLEIMLTDYCQVNTSCWWSVVYPIKIFDRLYFIVLIFKLRTKNTVSIHPKTKILFVLSCWYFCASLYCFLLALYLGDWSEAVNYGWISFAVWHFNQRDSSAAACVYVCVCLTLWVKHTHTTALQLSSVQGAVKWLSLSFRS